METDETSPGMEDRLRCLEAVLSPDRASGVVHRIETHMSWILIGERQVLKLKKPVCYPFLDFSTVQARERNSREELRLNRRLAPQIYLGLLALQLDGGLLRAVPENRLPAHARIVDWAVVMQRLPAQRMLDQVIARAEVRQADIDAVAAILVPFYRNAARAHVGEVEYVQRLRHELSDNRDVLERPEFGLADVRRLSDRMGRAITQHEGLLRRRVVEARIVDGHGDLRPEHVALTEPPVVIDALEFDSRLREVDPFDELSFLGLECTVAGDSSVGPGLRARLALALQDAPPAQLHVFYTARRALLRARLSAAHLLDPAVRTPGKWLPQASRYLVHAAAALDDLERCMDA